MSVGGYTPDFNTPPDEQGWDGRVDSFGRPEQSKLMETERVFPPEDAPFDDTFQISTARLREANNEKFERGVPTNNKTSSKNYPPELVKIIDGEHKTLLTLGKISEAMDGDDDDIHLTEHRLLLADDDLSETQRASLLEHIASHLKSKNKKLKAAKEAAEANAPGVGPYKRGLGRVSRSLPAVQDDMIPQDDPQSAERKRTSGVISQEAGGFSAKVNRFRRALKTAGRGL